MLSLSFQVRHVWGEPNDDMRPRDLAVFANQAGTYLGVFGFQNDWYETVSLDGGGFDIDTESVAANAPDITLNFGTQSVAASGAPISWAFSGLNSTDLSHANYAVNYTVSQNGSGLSLLAGGMVSAACISFQWTMIPQLPRARIMLPAIMHMAAISQASLNLPLMAVILSSRGLRLAV